MIAFFKKHFRQLKKYFISDIDQALDKMRKANEFTPSQLAEFEKYERIYQLRDQTK